ncbi:hypothetical protein F5Y16DRAFT_401334 [Xylariaceae sp. FL0255]|nr:hypothetical protein F5Y16DRAFT_401334 [Xylariaceae sp. FL0255]
MAQLSIHDVAGKGVGTFAERPIKAGTLLTDEAQLIKIPYEDRNTIQYNFRVLEAFKELNDENETAFFKLSMSENAFTRVRALFSLHNIKPDEKSVAICAIFNTNAVNMGEGVDDGSERGVFSQHCRINHSCSPNATYSYHNPSGHLQVYATCDIASGEEVSVSYIEGLMRSKADRLKDMPYFNCVCRTCTSPDIKSSDSRRRRISAIMNGIKVFMSSESAAPLVTRFKAARGISAAWFDNMMNLLGGAAADAAVVPTSAEEALTLIKEWFGLLARESITGTEVAYVWGMLALVYKLLGDSKKNAKDSQTTAVEIKMK